jgi:hypothetical protein
MVRRQPALHRSGGDAPDPLTARTERTIGAAARQKRSRDGPDLALVYPAQRKTMKIYLLFLLGVFVGVVVGAATILGLFAWSNASL